jgi:hypothetical protein
MECGREGAAHACPCDTAEMRVANVGTSGSGCELPVAGTDERRLVAVWTGVPANIPACKQSRHEPCMLATSQPCH